MKNCKDVNSLERVLKVVLWPVQRQNRVLHLSTNTVQLTHSRNRSGEDFRGRWPWESDCFVAARFDTKVLRQAVQHSDAVLMYVPKYWPKDGIRAGHIEPNINLYRNPFAAHLKQVIAQRADRFFPLATTSYITYRVHIKLAN